MDFADNKTDNTSEYTDIRPRFRSKLVTDIIYRINSSSRVKGLSVAVDEDDNVYVLGQFFQRMFASNILLETTESAIFLAQINSDGSWRWANIIQEHPSSNDIRMSCEVTYSRGFLYSAMVIGNVATGNTEGFVIKTDRGGNIQYKTTFVGGLEPTIRISIDKCDNAYIVNSYVNKLELTTNLKLSNTTGTTRGYVAKLNKAGEWIWVQEIQTGNGTTNGINGSSALNGIVTKPNGKSFVVGWFIGVVKLGDITINGTKGKTSNRNFILAEIDSKGNWVRVKSFPNGEGTGIDMDRHENLYIVGGFQHKLRLGGACVETCGIHLFVAKLDRSWCTEWVVTTRYDSELFTSIINIVVDNDNNSYISGPFDKPISFNHKILCPRGPIDEFVAKVSPDGCWESSLQISGSDNVLGSKNIGVNQTCDGMGDEVYITGGFNNELIVGKEKEFGPTTSLFLARIESKTRNKYK